MIWVLLVISICISSYFGYRAYYLAGTVSDAQEYIEELEAVNVFMYTNIKTAYDNMKIIDHKGAFESEDEAGTTFSLLLETIETLKEQFDNEETKSKEK